MKNAFLKYLLAVTIAVGIVIVVFTISSNRKPDEYYPLKHYNSSGTTKSVTKCWMQEVSPSTGNGYSVDISSASFSEIMSVSVVPVKNTATATSVPKVAIKSTSTSAIVLNIIEGNPNTVNILGNLVSLGVTETFANTSGLTLQVCVQGN